VRVRLASLTIFYRDCGPSSAGLNRGNCVRCEIGAIINLTITIADSNGLASFCPPQTVRRMFQKFSSQNVL